MKKTDRYGISTNQVSEARKSMTWAATTSEQEGVSVSETGLNNRYDK